MTARKGASAPGKLMVSGEYAVLEGSVAVVASAGARVSALWSPDGIDRSVSRSDDSSQSRPLPPEAALTRRLAEHRVGKVESALVIDVTDLRKSGRKLGLGSSAAASAAVAGAVFAHPVLRQPTC